MRYLASLPAALCGVALPVLLSCSGDTTASEKKQVPVAAASPKSEADTFASLAALRPRDRTADQDVQLAIFHAEMGHTEDAFASLADAAVKGFSDVERLRSEPKLAALRSDERWQQVELFVDVNGAQGSLPDQSAHPPEPVQAQRPMPPSAKVNIAAPDWSLTDAAGNVVRLSDLRGKVVIMDFWATWCGPCKRSMPEIDKFTRKYAGQNLAVFSVNVWDRSADVVLEWWREQDYSMQLLFGSRELTTAYEVQGIPHLCVIDGEGIIRYSQAGFHPQLLDYLVKWTESARKDG